MLKTAASTYDPLLKQDIPANAPAKLALSGLALSMLLASLGTSIANVSLPTLAQLFGAGFQEIQWVVLSYLVAMTALIVGVGRLGDVFGPRRVLLLGIGTFVAGSSLCAVAPSLGVLVAARAVQGVGAAVMIAMSLAFVSVVWPQARIGRAMGILGTMSAVGTAVGPSLGGGLISVWGWRAIFLINFPLGAVAYVMAKHHLPADTGSPRTAQQGFNGTGMLMLAVALAAYAVGMTTGKGQFGWANIGWLLVAISTAAFLFVESKSRPPLIEAELLEDPRLRGRLLGSGIVSTVVMTTLVVGPFFLSSGLRLKTATVGLVLSVGPAVAAMSGVPAGHLVDAFSARCVTIVGLTGIAVGCIALALMPAWAGLPGYLGPVIMITLGYALFQTANNTAVMQGIPASRRGVTSGILNLSRNLGLVTGASVMTAVFAWASGEAMAGATSHAAIVRGMHATFAVAAVLTLIAIAIAWREPQRDGVAPRS